MKQTCTLLLTSLLCLTGCFSQRAFPADLEAVAHAEPIQEAMTTRAWLQHTQPQLAPLLPQEKHAPLLTEDLVVDGAPRDVLGHFRRNPDTLHTLLGNLQGLEDSAQATGADTSEGIVPPAWEGFEDVEIPVAPGISYSGRLGIARQNGQPIRSNCVVILPGILGDMAVWRTRDISLALRASGMHVLAVEMRGMGGTNRRHPDVHCVFGVQETDDLIEVAKWAQRKPFVEKTGMLGFCWGANHALTAAWAIGREPNDPDIPERMKPLLRPRPDTPVYEAGMLTFSPVLRFEEIVASCRTPTGMLDNPVINSLQGTVEGRMVQKQHREISGDLGQCIAFEFERNPGYYEGMVDDGMQYLRLLPHQDLPCGPRLNAAPMPVLIVQGANDPLTSAQNVADLMAMTSNPDVAGLVLAGGGHIGFAPYARDYFYSLIINFFDPQTGPAAARQ